MVFATCVSVFAFVILCCEFAGSIASYLRVIDIPDGVRKLHIAPTPLVGGIALMPPLAIYALVEAVAMNDYRTQTFVALALVGLGAMLLGLIDDRAGVRVAVRLLISSCLCIVAIMIEPQMIISKINFFGPDLTIVLGVLAIPFTLICTIGLLNAVNMADGKNGLVISLSLVWVACMMPYAPEFLRFYMVLLICALSVILFYNWQNKLFLGDSGSYSIGFVLSLLAIYIYNHADERLSAMVVGLWFLIPVIDCLRLIADRLRKGRLPWAADANHLHHRLAACWQWPGCVLIYVAMAAFPSIGASLWPDAAPLFLVLGLAAYAWVMIKTRRRYRIGSIVEQY